MNITEQAQALYELLPTWKELNCREQSDALVELRDLQLRIDPEKEEHVLVQMYLDSFAVQIGVWVGEKGEIEPIGIT